MSRKVLIALAIVLVVVLAGGIYLSRLLSSEELGRKLLAAASEASGVELAAQKIDVGLFSGIDLVGVTAKGEHSGGSYEVSLEQLVFDYRILPLLSGELVVDQVLLDQPRVLLVNRAASPGAGPSEEGPGERPGEPVDAIGVSVRVSQVAVQDGTILVQKEIEPGSAADQIEIQGLTIELNEIVFDPALSPPIRRLAGRGSLEADQVKMGELVARELEGRLQLEAGIATVSELELTMDQGALQADLSLDLNPAPFKYQIKAVGDPLNTNRIVGLPENGSLGPGRLELDAFGEGPESRNLQAQGLLSLENGRLPEHALFKGLELALGMKSLVGAEYQASEARFNLANDRLTLEPFGLSTESAAVALAGTVELSGPIEMSIQVSAPRSAVTVDKVPAALLEALADERGWISVPVRVTGTLQEPRILPDANALLAQVAGQRGLFGKAPVDSDTKQKPSSRLPFRRP